MRGLKANGDASESAPTLGLSPRYPSTSTARTSALTLTSPKSHTFILHHHVHSFERRGRAGCRAFSPTTVSPPLSPLEPTMSSLTRPCPVCSISRYRSEPKLLHAAVQDADGLKHALDALLLVLVEALTKPVVPSVARYHSVRDCIDDIKLAWRGSPLRRNLLKLVKQVVQDVETHRDAAWYVDRLLSSHPYPALTISSFLQ